MEQTGNLEAIAPRAGEAAATIAAFAERDGLADPFVAGCRDAILPMAISDPSLPDNPIVYVNAAFEMLTGYSRHEVLRRNCRFLQGPMTDAGEVARLRAAIRARAKVSVDLLNHRKDGSPFWNRLLVTPVCDDDGTLRYFFASQHDVTAERDRVVALEAEQLVLLADAERTLARLADSEARLSFALKAGQLGTWALNPETLHLDASSSCKAAFGYGPDARFGYAEFERTIHPEDAEIVRDAIDATVRTGAPYDIEYRILTPGGEQRWIAAQGELLTRGDGSPLSMTGFATDISARKHAKEHRSLLAGELTHRVKNTLATVSAVVNQTLRNASSIEEATEVVGGRIASLATAHDLLLKDEVDGASVGDIVAGVLRPFDGGDGHLYTAMGPDVRLSPPVTLALSMALHELATNAVKYGAFSAPDGKVTVRWSTFKKRGRSWLTFDWIEEGAPARPAPAPGAPHRRGFGSELIEGRIPYELRGRGQVTIEPGGAQCHLEFPLQDGASILETGAPQRATVFGGVIDMTGEADLTNRCILVVEDDYYLATDIARALRGAGAEVLGPCATEKDARTELDERRPDAVVVDINLGLGPSFKLAETLKDAGIPFMFITGYDAEVIPAEFEAVDRLQKPVQLRQIVSAVAKLTTTA